jgi:DNA topoisomerase-3
MKVVLCEKPSVARDVASHLKAQARRDGYFEGNGWAVTWAFGHLVELQEPEDYDPALKRWSLESLPIVPPEFRLRPRGDKGARAQLSVVKKLFKDASEIVCATDAGREGELIFRYILSFARAEKKPVRRLWVSSLTSEALARGFQKLLPASDFDALYQAARSRSEADWIVGINSTRYFTVAFGGAGRLWSVGRVQTPVLAMVVQRDLEIENFVEQDYWELHTLFKDVRFKHKHGKFEKRDEAEALLTRVQGQEFRVKSIEERREAVKPPLLYDLTDLQKDMNRRFGLSADETLKAAQSLYERKLLTYPRTDSRHITQDMAREIPALFAKLKSLKPEWIAKVDLGRLHDGKRIVNDLKVTDHHALLPTGSLPRDLGPAESKIFEAVLTRLIAAFYPDAIKITTLAVGESAGEEFKASGTFTQDPGWEALYPKRGSDNDTSGDEANSSIKQLQRSDRGPHEPEVKTLKTRPPLPFTEATLLHVMETAGKSVDDETLRAALKERGLGTPATRASIIETLLRRGYLERKKKQILSTSLGRELIRIVQDRRLKSAELTGEWEARLKSIENGSDNATDFLNEVIEHTRSIVKASLTGMELGPCPLCKAPVIAGKRGYGCTRWKEGCEFVLLPKPGGPDLTPSYVMRLLNEKAAPTPAPAAPHDGSAELCPLCHGSIVESPKAYGCSNWKQGCRFTLWKIIAKKKISQKILKELLQKGRTSLLKGFKSKAGKSFEARLVLLNGEVKFEFDKGPSPENKA